MANATLMKTAAKAVARTSPASYRDARKAHKSRCQSISRAAVTSGRPTRADLVIKRARGASRSKNQGDGSDRQHAGETGEGPSLVVNGRALQGAGPRQALQETAGQIGQGLGQTLAVVVEALPGFVGERLGAGQDCLNLAARELMARMPPNQL